MSGLTFIHLTDCHLLDQKTKLHCNINTYESLSRTIKDIINKKLSYDFLLVSGDISQDGSQESYQLFFDLIKTLNKPVYCLPGNHDDPILLKNFFRTSPNQAISVNLVQNHWLILLNSHQSELESGNISANQLNQLNNILTKNPGRPVIIAVHHPPIAMKSTWMDKIGLLNGNELLIMLEKFDEIKLLFFGHVHQEIEQRHKNFGIISTPSTCYQFKPQQTVMTLDTLNPGYRLITSLSNGQIETQVFRLND